MNWAPVPDILNVSILLIADLFSTRFFQKASKPNKADIIVCGGVDELRDLAVWAYSDLGLLSNSANNLYYASQPYLGQATGMILGEATAMIVLERRDHAIQRKATMYAEVLGYTTIRDRSSSIFLFDRTSEDISYTMSAAMHDAGLYPTEIGFVLGCASAHPSSSSAELKAVEEIWRDSDIKVTNIKGAFGETFGSAATLGLSAAALALSNHLIPSCGMIPIRSNKSVEIVVRQALPTQARFCLCNSMHVSGNNTCIILADHTQGEIQQ